LAGEAEEKTKWTVGVGVGPSGFSAWISREVERLKRLTEKPKGRSFFTRKAKPTQPDNIELRDEFRAFLQTVKENVHLYLWYALTNLVDRNVDRKFEAQIYKLFGNVASSFLLIETNFDPSLITTDLLDFLKDRITKISSPGSYDVMGNASVIGQGDGDRLFLNSVGRLETMLTEMRSDLSKYFKRDEVFEAARDAAVAEAMKNR
jgi:hypothetical protein